MSQNGIAKAVTKELLGHNIKEADYAIQEYIVQLADELAARMKKGEKLPFTKFYACDNDNPLALGQPPITFPREVVAATMCPQLLESPDISADAKERAKVYLSQVDYPQAIGAYSDGPGLTLSIEAVRKFLEETHQAAANPEHIFLMNGASDAAMTLLDVIIAGTQDAVPRSSQS
jgi:aspartate/methionine/tyrosine aminotransferase